MKVEDVCVHNRHLWIRLHEKGGKPTKRPATTILKPTCTPILTAAGSRAIRKTRCFGRSAAALTC
jgi:hypothetical protein